MLGVPTLHQTLESHEEDGSKSLERVCRITYAWKLNMAPNSVAIGGRPLSTRACEDLCALGVVGGEERHGPSVHRLLQA